MDSDMLWRNYPRPESLPPPVIRDPSLPLVSVVTPSYNQGAFIRETIESVLGQDYPNIEHWVIDGGSTDETLAIVREYERDPRFHWLSERDRGQADAVNKGWRRCQGAIIGWLNSDDVYLPAALRSLVGELLAHPECDLAFGDGIIVDEHGAQTGVMYGEPIDMGRLLRGNYIVQPAVLQRRRVVERLGPLDPALRYALDYDFYLRAARDYRFRYLPRPVATYRIHTSSKTATGGSRFYQDLYGAVRRFLAAPGAPPLSPAEQRRVQSDWLLRIAMEYIKEREGRAAFRAAVYALLASPLRPRALLVALTYLDHTLGVSSYDAVVRAWLELRRRVKRASAPS